MAWMALACSGGGDFAGGGNKSGSKGKDKGAEKDTASNDDKKKPVADDSSVDDDGAVEETPSKDSLKVDPKNVTLFKGETVEVTAELIEFEGDARDVTEESKWSSKSKSIATVEEDGTVTATGGGKTVVKAKFVQGNATLSDEMTVNVVECKETAVDSSTKAALVKIDGENWPYNTVDPGGGDKNDYHVQVTGQFLVDGFQIFSSVDQSVQVSYALGSPGSTTQTVKLAIINCAGEISGEHDVSTGSGSQSLNMKKGERFTLITTAKTGIQTRVFQLDKDTADAKAVDAFRVTLK